MENEGLSVVCAGLGDDDGSSESYAIGEYCLDNLKDIQRFLRRDDPQRRDVFKQICRWNVASRDLIPIIEQHQSDRDLVINAVKVLVFLTMPIDPTSDDIAQQVEYLWDLKAALTRNVAIAVIVALLEGPLEHLESDEFAEDDWKLVQLVLTLFRNVLAIQGISAQQKASGTATRFMSLRDNLLEIMFQENVMDLILVLAQHLDGSSAYISQDNLLILEIFHYIFMGQDPGLIAKTSRKDSKDEDIKTSVDSLRLLMEEEEEKRRMIRQRNLERHSQFSGTFTRFTMDGSKTLFKGNPAAACGDGLLKVHKVQRGPHKRIAWDHETISIPKENILESLYNFLSQFLLGGYNVLMQSILTDIRKERLAFQNSDAIIFFQVADFVITFQHHKVSLSKKPSAENTTAEASLDNGFTENQSFHGDFCGPIASTMNEAMFHLVTSKWREAFENLKEFKDHKFLSASVSLTKSMIRMIDLVLKSSPDDSKESQTARILLYKIFYDQTDQGLTHFLLNLFRSFDNHKQPKSDLADLLEIIHIVLRLMEKLQARGTLRVSTKSRKSRKKKILKGSEKADGERVREEHITPLNPDDQTEKPVMPMEPIVDPDNSTKNGARESGSVEKEDNIGKEVGKSASDPALEPDILPQDPDDQTNDVSQIDIDKISDNLSPAAKSGTLPHGTEQLRDDLSHIDSDKDSSDDNQPPSTNEVDFHVSKLVATFANHAVIQNLCWLLKYYKSNSATTNHYIICMLRRFCDDLEISPMLYQLSVLTTFYDILADKNSSKEHQSIVYFLTKFIRKMLKLMKKQPLFFVEILFWKTRKECHYINAEALMSDIVKMKSDIKNWDDGVNMSNDNGQPASKSIADSLGEDEVDVAFPHDLNYQREETVFDGDHQNNFQKTKSAPKRNSMPPLPDNENDTDESKGTSSKAQTQKASGKGSVFSEEQEASIKDLYEKYKDNRRCSRLIAEELDPVGKISPLQVTCKLRQLGLKVAARKTLSSADVPLPVGNDPTGADGGAIASSTDARDSNKMDNSLSTEIPHAKKRSRFNKEKEDEVKILFERFKNHTKCSEMIANALVADKSYTPAQVSRKLKQLGLFVPNKRSTKAAKHSGGEVGEIREQSDKETSSTVKKRNRIKKSKLSKEALMTHVSEDETIAGVHDSDNEILSSMLKSKRKKSKASTEKAAITDLTQDETRSEFLESDNEILSTMINKRKKSKSSDKKAAMTDLTLDEARSGTVESDDEILSTMIKKKGFVSSEGQQVEGGNTALDDLETEPNSSGKEQDGRMAILSSDPWSEQQKHDEVMEDLIESDDDIAPVLPRKMGSRRNLKMVIDAEDD